MYYLAILVGFSKAILNLCFIHCLFVFCDVISFYCAAEHGVISSLCAAEQKSAVSQFINWVGPL